jgi:selenocysteine lyase/cysteine desulfurase
MNGQNNWNVGYSSILFMERVLNSHIAVALFERVNDIQFIVERANSLSKINVVFVNEYHLGEAAAYAIIDEFDGVEVIVNNGNWNHILVDWREFADRTGIIILKVSDFIGAINVEDLRKYVTEEEREERRQKRRKSS